MSVYDFILPIFAFLVGVVGVSLETKKGGVNGNGVNWAGKFVIVLLFASMIFSLNRARDEAVERGELETELDTRQRAIDSAQFVRDVRQVVLDACDKRPFVRGWVPLDREAVRIRMDEYSSLSLGPEIQRFVEIIGDGGRLDASMCEEIDPTPEEMRRLFVNVNSSED
jgi:hypothetical protein